MSLSRARRKCVGVSITCDVRLRNLKSRRNVFPGTGNKTHTNVTKLLLGITPRTAADKHTLPASVPYLASANIVVPRAGSLFRPVAPTDLLTLRCLPFRKRGNARYRTADRKGTAPGRRAARDGPRPVGAGQARAPRPVKSAAGVAGRTGRFDAPPGGCCALAYRMSSGGAGHLGEHS